MNADGAQIGDTSMSARTNEREGCGCLGILLVVLLAILLVGGIRRAWHWAMADLPVPPAPRAPGEGAAHPQG